MPRASTSRVPCSPMSVMRSRRERPLVRETRHRPGSSARRLGGSANWARSRAAQDSNSQVSTVRAACSGLQHQRQVGGGDAAAAAGQTACFLDGCGVGAGGRDVGELGGGRQVGLLRARQGGERLTGTLLDEDVVVEGGDAGAGAAMREDDRGVAFARIQEEGQFPAAAGPRERRARGR
jgi:hypothetical protein